MLECDDGMFAEFVSVPRDDFSKQISQPSVPDAVAATCAAGLIEMGRDYIPQWSSREWRFTNLAISSGWTTVAALGKPLRKKQAPRPIEELIPDSSDTECWQLEMLRKLRVDHVAALPVVEMMSIPKKLQYLATVSEFADGSLEMTRCDYGRLHSAFTRFPKEMRQFWRYEELPIVGRDGVASQPILLADVLSDRVCESELRRYLDIAENPNSGIYEWVLKHAPEAFNGIDAANERRSVAKKLFMAMLCGGNKPRDSRVQMVLSHFESTFPALAEAIREIKKPNAVDKAAHDAERKRYKPYAKLAHMLQRAESAVFLSAAKKLSLTARSRPCLVLYDSLWTWPSDAAHAAAAIAEAFAEKGLRVTVSATDLNQQVA